MTKETYLKSVDVLLDAYNTGNLFHGFCKKCAVGNLLNDSEWGYLFMSNKNHQRIFHVLDSEREMRILKSFKKRGFTKEELMKIEEAFEMSLPNSDKERVYYLVHNRKKGQYIGLCAVLDVMKEMVEEPVPTESKQSQEKLDTIYSKFTTVNT